MSDDQTLYLDFDYDRPDRRSPHLRPFFTVLRMVDVKPRCGVMCMERTRHGWHVVIPLVERLLPSEIVALQFALGSDGRREALNLMRALSIRKHGADRLWRRHWNILFSEKLK